MAEEDEDDDEIDRMEEDSRVGKLLYEINEKHVQCTGHIERTVLQFYEHLLVVHYEVRFLCFPTTGTYLAEAIPRFKILNVTFTSASRGQWRWALLMFLVGIILLIIGALGDSVALIVIGVLLAVLIAPIPFLWKSRYVNIDVKGVSSCGRWCSSAKTYTFRFRKAKPDEGFIMDYIFCDLRKDFSPFHALAHLHDVSLAHPLQPKDDIMRQAWLDDVSSSAHQHHKASSGLMDDSHTGRSSTSRRSVSSRRGPARNTASRPTTPSTVSSPTNSPTADRITRTAAPIDPAARVSPAGSSGGTPSRLSASS